MDAASKGSRLEQPRDGGVLMQRMVRPSLTRAQREVLDAIVKDTHDGKSWMNPRNLPHWVKNPWQACQILERKGYVESQWIETATCYRPNHD